MRVPARGPPYTRHVSRRREILISLVLVVAVVTLGLSSARALLSTPGPGPTGLQLLVAPHPDDELLVFAALEDDPSVYTVVVTLTRGEQTNRCDDVTRYLDEDRGERAPRPLPGARGGPECAAARLDSWTHFLKQAADVTPGLAVAGAERQELADRRFQGEASAWIGKAAARLVLNLPDGGLDVAGVEAALEGVLDLRGAALPALPLRRILGASYWNDSPDRGTYTTGNGGCERAYGCPGDRDAFEYENQDHYVVTQALVGLAEEARLGAWISTAPGKNDALVAALGASQETSWREMALDEEDYAAYMGLEGPREAPLGDRRRTGLQQVAYGWLAFPGPAWEPGEQVTSPGNVLFPRRQHFLVVPAGS